MTRPARYVAQQARLARGLRLGRARAQYVVGVMYDEGIGVKQDDAEAVRWYELAAEQGYAKARRALVALALRGRSAWVLKLGDGP